MNGKGKKKGGGGKNHMVWSSDDNSSEQTGKKNRTREERHYSEAKHESGNEKQKRSMEKRCRQTVRHSTKHTHTPDDSLLSPKHTHSSAALLLESWVPTQDFSEAMLCLSFVRHMLGFVFFAFVSPNAPTEDVFVLLWLLSFCQSSI